MAARMERVSAQAWFTLDQPIESTNYRGEPMIGATVVWDHTAAVLNGEPYDNITARVYSESLTDCRTVAEARYGEPLLDVPDWCPLPPLGWNEQVEKFRDELAARAVAR